MPWETDILNLPVSQLLDRWRARRGEILKTLAPELREEYRTLGKQIKAVLAERTEPPNEIKSPKGFFDLPRIPLLRHKRAQIDFLRARRESATRKEIIAATSIPAGSLSSLLKAKEFERDGRGLWKLKEGVR